MSADPAAILYFDQKLASDLGAAFARARAFNRTAWLDLQPESVWFLDEDENMVPPGTMEWLFSAGRGASLGCSWYHDELEGDYSPELEIELVTDYQWLRPRMSTFDLNHVVAAANWVLPLDAPLVDIRCYSAAELANPPKGVPVE